MGFKIATLQHVLEGYKVAKEIAAHGAGASTFSDWWGYKIEAIDAIPYNAALMTRKGVLVSINSDSAEHARRLNTEAAKSIKWGGLTEDEALALVTINPAKQLRIDNRVGSLEVGKDADVVDLESPSAQHLRHRRSRLHRRHASTTTAIADDRAADRRSVKEKRTSIGRRTRHARPSGNLRSRDQREPAGRTRRALDAGRAPARARRRPSGRTDARDLARSSAITNARIHPITRPDIERGTIVMRGAEDRGARRQRAGAGGRRGHRRGRRGRLSRASSTRVRRWA